MIELDIMEKIKKKAEREKDIQKTVGYMFDASDKKNIIKPINYINKTIEYTSQELWGQFNNLEGSIDNNTYKLVYDYIIDNHIHGKKLLEIFNELAESYVRNLDDIHKRLLCSTVKFGRECNNLVASNTSLEKGIYNMMFKHFSFYLRYLDKSNEENEEGIKIFERNIGVMDEILYMNF